MAAPGGCQSRVSAVRVSARLALEDLAELYQVDLADDDVETVAGLLGQALGRVPIPGASATVQGLRMTAEGTTGRRNRIDTVLVRPEQVPARESEERQTADAP